MASSRTAQVVKLALWHVGSGCTAVAVLAAEANFDVSLVAVLLL